MARRRNKKKNRKQSRSRLLSLKSGIVITVLLIIWGVAGEWYVHHSRKWLDDKKDKWPAIVTAPLLWFGNPLADITDGLGWTGHDAIYEYDTEAPFGSILFAGAPKREGSNAPDDITIVERSEFIIGWSNKLRHPAWVAYHVTREGKFDAEGKRPSFKKDKSIESSPRPDEYSKSGYDRGHMAPNYAIVSRYGEDAQKQTFLMSNIAPQTPQLNRGVWRDIEHRIAELWTQRYGEIWVVVGAVTSPENTETLRGTNINVPQAYYQVITAQEGMQVRALAMLIKQDVGYGEWAARNIITIDELEEITGLNFNPDLPEFIASPLEAELPSRLWPIRVRDILKQIWLRYRSH
jgi:endonuclease G